MAEIESANEHLIRAALAIWPFDREPMQWGVEMGVFWAIVQGQVAGVNGYALVPAEGHPWSKGWPKRDDDDYEDLVAVHGGVTYSNHPWLGFDTVHAWDVWPPEYDPHGISSRHTPTDYDKAWTPFLVAEEAKRLAVQIAAIGAACQAARHLPMGDE